MRPTGKAWQNGGTDVMAAPDKGKGKEKGREKGGSRSSDRSQLYHGIWKGHQTEVALHLPCGRPLLKRSRVPLVTYSQHRNDRCCCPEQ
eukprot:14465747-Heterocapsa_arctica.AAC.1